MQINKVLSDCLNIKAGVPQGSLLGPILLLIYINNIYASIPDASVYLYANDLTLVFCDDEKHSLINKVNENLLGRYGPNINYFVSLNTSNEVKYTNMKF